jgi:hypothetical protein
MSSDEPVADEDGIYEDSDRGYEPATITVETTVEANEAPAPSEPQPVSISNDDLLVALEKLARETGTTVIPDKPYQINELTLQKLLGANYDDLIKGMSSSKLILPGIDEMNDEVFEVSFTAYGLERLGQRFQQVREQKVAAHARQVERATADAKLLLQYFHPKQPDEAVRVTAEKLKRLLAEPSEDRLEQRLDLLYTTKILTASICGDGEYELVFLTKGIELAEEMPRPPIKPGPKTHRTQLTRTREDGTKVVIDIRNLVNAVLSTPERASRACLYWVDVFKDPESPSQMKTRVRLNLERADALWGRDLEKENPGLYLHVMQALGHPEKAAVNPILAMDDMEAGF